MMKTTYINKICLIVDRCLPKSTLTTKDLRKLKHHILSHLESEISLEVAHITWRILSKEIPGEWYSQRIQKHEVVEFLHEKLMEMDLGVLSHSDLIEQGHFSEEVPLMQSSIIEVEETMAISQPLGIPANNQNVEEDLVAFTLSESNTDQFNVVFNKAFHSFPGLKGMHGKAEINGELVLGYFTEISTVNAESSARTYQGHIEMTSAIHGIIQNDYTGDKKIGKFNVQRIRSQLGFHHLGNSPDSFTKIYTVSSEDLDQFHTSPSKDYVRFCSTIRDHWALPVEVIPFAFWGVGLIAATRQGKGYLMTAMLLSLAGTQITTGKKHHRKIGVCYFDYNGQWGTDEYGFFTKLSHDPRVIIKAQDIGFDNNNDFVEFLFRQYNLFQLGFANQKMDSILDYLGNHVDLTVSYERFLEEVENAIHTAYEGNPEQKSEKMLNHIENEGGEALWNKKIQPFVEKQNIAYEILEKGLDEGKIVIIDLGDIRPPYKPGVVYKVLRHLLNNAKEAFIKNNHEEYVYSTLVILDEAHNYCPEVGKGHNYPYQEKCKTIVKSISADSAKYGLGIGIITQRYAWLSKDILANIRTFFIGPLGATDSTNEMVKTILNGKDVSKLSKFQFYALGDAVSCPGEIVKSFNPTQMQKYLINIKSDGDETL